MSTQILVKGTASLMHADMLSVKDDNEFNW